MMRVRVKSADLAAAMKHSIAQRTSTLEVLQHASLQAGDESLRITTTDLEAVVCVEIPAVVEEAGSVCADAAKLAAAAGLGEDLALAEKDTVVHVRGAGRSAVKLSTVSHAQFPVPDDEVWRAMDVDPLELREAIETVAYAAGKNDVRYYLNAVHITSGAVEASDGHRAARCPINYRGPSILVPISRIDAIAGALTAQAVVEMVTERKLRVRTPGFSIEVLLVKANFPDVERLVPIDSSDIGFTVERVTVARGANALAPFIERSLGGKVSRVAIRSGDGNVTLTDDGENQVDVAGARDVSGQFDTNYELRYIRQAIDACGGKDATVVRFEQFNKMAMLHSPGKADRHIVMGMS